jgi:hypothetical protein
VCLFGAAKSLLSDLIYLLKQQALLARMATHNQTMLRKPFPFWDKNFPQEPTTFEEAVQNGQWKEAMAEEHQSIMKNEVWEIVPKPKEKSVVTSNCVYKIKHAADGSVDKYKARFVARGFS